jgi:hypothetical protein
VVDSPEQAVRILQLDLVTLRALAAGDLVEAQRHVPVELTGYLVEPDSRSLWQMRVGQVARDPDSAAWVTGVVVDERTGRPSADAATRGPRCSGCSRGLPRSPTCAWYARR